MKIAYILDLFPALSETFIVREILELKRRGIEVLILARKNTAGTEYGEVVHSEAMSLISNVQYYPAARRKIVKFPQLFICHLYFLLFNPIRYARALSFVALKGRKATKIFLCSVYYALKVKREQVDHLHVHFVLNACTHAMFTSMLTGIPYTFTAHAHDIFIPDRAQLLEEKLTTSKFAICISEYNKNFILEKFPEIRANKLHVIHCGIEPNKFSPKPKKKNDIFTVLAIGRLVEQKGFEYLVKACEILKKNRGLDFICNIIGEGRDRHLLETIIYESHLSDNVRLLGALEQDEVLKYLRTTDLFVLPCVVDKNGSMDGIPVSLMEAMALGVPVISTTVSGIPELVENGAGLLVQERDILGLALAIQSVYALPQKEREKMGNKGRTLIKENFNLEKEVARLIALFEST